MGASWFVRPATRTVPLSDGQWVRVKERLTAGEFRAHLKRSSYVDPDGLRHLDTLQQGLSLIVAYLVDWSLEAGIAGIAESDLIAVLDTLEPPRFMELKLAIEAHDTAMTEAREQEKNGTDGSMNTAAIWPSPSAAAGVSSGSAT